MIPVRTSRYNTKDMLPSLRKNLVLNSMNLFAWTPLLSVLTLHVGIYMC